MTYYKRLLSLTLLIGKQMLISGAEVSRVEDTIVRILISYGAEEVNVHTITSCIIVTAKFENGEIFTQVKRITKYKTDFNKLDLLNNLSRKICENKPELDYIEHKINDIKTMPEYGFLLKTFAAALICWSFTIFFGGNFFDANISAVIGIVVNTIKYFSEKLRLNLVILNIISSFVISILAFFFVIQLKFGDSIDKIIIGNIMPLIPGIALTNSMRDIIIGDTISGSLRFFEACLIALAISGGYMLALYIAGGVGWSI